jgi:hypothetical protein
MAVVLAPRLASVKPGATSVTNSHFDATGG